MQHSGNGVPIFQHISCLTNLNILSLSFAASTDLSIDDLLSLATLTKLEELAIGPDEGANASAVTAYNSGFSDSDFDSMLSNLKSLCRINFSVQCRLSTAAMVSLWKYHPLLEECVMPQILDMQPLGLVNSQRAVFPKLGLLEVGAFGPSPMGIHGSLDR